jgi:site-specific recombinase XerD
MRYLFASAGITDRGLHSLRHTAATAMVNGGASFKDVSDVLGHKSITTTLIYAKLDLKSLMQVACCTVYSNRRANDSSCPSGSGTWK